MNDRGEDSYEQFSPRSSVRLPAAPRSVGPRLLRSRRKPKSFGADLLVDHLEEGRSAVDGQRETALGAFEQADLMVA